MIKKTKQAAPVNPDQTVSDVFATILRHNFNYLELWEGAARSWDDIEGVHQMRVSFRRMRSALSAFRSAIPKSASQAWSEEMRGLASQLGMARDLDVFISEGLADVKGILPLPGEEKMLRLAEAHREKSYESVRTMLDSDAYARFKQEFPAWIDSRGWEQGELKPKHAKRLAEPVVPFSRRLLDRLERKVLEAGSHVHKEVAQEMHRLRIECKKLRYGAEFFLPILTGLEEFIGHMKGLQNLLGVLNDISVMRHLLEVLLKDEKDPAVLEYAGGLVGWRTRQYYDLLDSFEQCWDEFTHAKHPWWSKSTTTV